MALANVTIHVPVVKKNAAKMLAFGFANVSVAKDGKTVVDLHDETISEAELENAAYQYVLRYREAGQEHEKMGVARLVESFFLTAEKLEAMGIKAKYEGAAWWVGYKVDDPDVWKRVESGDLSAFSIGGEAEVVEK